MKRNTALTSTFTNEFDKSANLSNAERIKRSPRARKGVARGVLLGFGAALCFVPNADSSNMSEIQMTAKQYAYYSLDNIKEYKCLASLYGKESAWNYKAYNISSGAVGIPQGKSIWLLTATPIEQTEWGMRYIKHRYSTMCNAWKHWRQYGWH